MEGIPICCNQKLVDAKEGDFVEPGEKVTQAGDGVLLGRPEPPVGTRKSAILDFVQLRYYDDEKDELDQVRDHAGRGKYLISGSLYVVHLQPRWLNLCWFSYVWWFADVIGFLFTIYKATIFKYVSLFQRSYFQAFFWPLIDEEVVVDQSGGAPEEHVLHLMTDSEDEGDCNGSPFQDIAEPAHPNPQQDIVQVDVKHPEILD